MLGAIVVALFALLPGNASAKSSLVAKGSVEQVHVFHAKPGKSVKLLRKGKFVDKDKAGDLGAVVFRKVKPGKGYMVKQGRAKAGSVHVMSTRSAPPSTKIYNQKIPADGYGYLKTRDGTKLALDVHPPQDIANLLGIDIPTPPSGKLPTLIEYAGYGYADPAGPQSGIQLIGNLMGFTVVDVNMRGTGCSGGAFDFFEPLQGLDAYDVIETVARQPWVDGNKVGMMGISYGGISQLFTAQYRPPSLAAISPLSVIDNTQTTLYPGGLLNTGFAYNWAEERVHDALPAGPDAGQGWAWKRIQEGDQTCKDNQAAHTEAVDLLAKVKRNKFYRPAAADPLDPTKFVHKINVPTFMACQWTDEQTGGHCPTLAAQFTGTGRKWFTYTNGVHTDSLDPETLNRWYDFLKIYVAKQAPIIGSATMQAAAPLLYQEAIGVPGVTLPPDPIQQKPTLAAAKQAFEGQPEVRVLFDNGAGDTPYKPVPGYIKGFDQFPPKTNVQKSWYLSKGGKMVQGKAGAKHNKGADKFKWDVKARPATDFTGDTGAGKLWSDHPDYDWSQPVKGKSVSYATKPLSKDTTVLGSGEVQLWVRSQAKNVDLQATVSEVRPDGKETFVQGGWLRTQSRKLDKQESSLGDPVPTYSKSDLQKLKKNKWVKLRVPLYYEGHGYRKGSRIRVTIQAPSGDQPIWAFAKSATHPRGKPWVAIAHDRKHPSRLVLPVTPGVDVPTGYPDCPGLRGEPCRDYQELPNKPFKR